MFPGLFQLQCLLLRFRWTLQPHPIRLRFRKFTCFLSDVEPKKPKFSIACCGVMSILDRSYNATLKAPWGPSRLIIRRPSIIAKYGAAKEDNDKLYHLGEVAKTGLVGA